jgi:N-acetylneuraminic acid mutarotase
MRRVLGSTLALLSLAAAQSNAATTDCWQRLNGAAPAARNAHTAVWTGAEMIVWGGVNTSFLNTGGRYDPTGNTWTTVTTTGAPAGRILHTAVWTGAEMIVWGGFYSAGGNLVYPGGGRYDPAAGTWVAMSTTGAPATRRRHTAVWTGTEMIVWGGENSAGRLNTGGVTTRRATVGRR